MFSQGKHQAQMAFRLHIQNFHRTYCSNITQTLPINRKKMEHSLTHAAFISRSELVKDTIRIKLKVYLSINIDINIF